MDESTDKNSRDMIDDDEATALFQESAKPAKLIITDQTGRKQEFHLLNTVSHIGRAEFCDIQIKDSAASDRHAKILAVGSNYIITDLQSQNGTRVNGAFINNHGLKDKDSIQIGRTFITFRFLKSGEPLLIEETEDLIGNHEATTVSPLVMPKKRGKTKIPKSSKVEVVRKKKGLSLFFATPVRAMATSFLLAFLLLTILISLGRNNQQGNEPGTLEDPGASSVNEKGPSGESEIDLSKRAEEYRSQKLIEQFYADAITAFNIAEAEYSQTMKSPTIAEIRNLVEQYENVKKSFQKVVNIELSYRTTDDYLLKTDEKIESLKRREFSIINARNQRIKRLEQAGTEFFNKGSLHNARRTFEELLTIDSRNKIAQEYLQKIQATINRSTVQNQMKQQVKNSVQGMEQALERGKNYYEAGKLASALKEWNIVEETFLTIDGNNSMKNTAEYANAKDIREKARIYRDSVTPKLDEIHEKARSIFGRGVTFESIGETEKAIAEWKQIFTFITDPEDEYYIKATQKIGKYE